MCEGVSVCVLCACACACGRLLCGGIIAGRNGGTLLPARVALGLMCWVLVVVRERQCCVLWEFGGFIVLLSISRRKCSIGDQQVNGCCVRYVAAYAGRVLFTLGRNYGEKHEVSKA